jgi:hypothetical protein
MQKDFNEAFILLKKKYEEKERNPREIQTYELLKKMIKVYGYNSVCDKISLNRQNNKNNELGIFIDNVKQNMPLELLCSQLFYLDDSISFQPEDNSKENQNSKSKLNGNNKPKENIVLFKSERKDLNEIIN